jgi:hypothetical protein
MNRPTQFMLEDEMIYWYITIVAADGTPLDADSDPTVAYRKDAASGTSTTGIVVTKVGTGLYRARHQTSLDVGVVLNTFLHYEETALVGGTTYKNNWSVVTRGVGTLAQSAAIKTVTDALPNSGALTDLATAANLATVDTVVDAVKVKTDQLTFTVSNQVDSNALTGGTSAADIYTYFTAGTNENAFKADITSLATLSAQSSQTSTLSTINETVDDAYTNTSTIISTTDAIKVKTDQLTFTVANQVDSNVLTGGGGDNAATIYTYFTDGTREDVFKADSTLAKQNEILAKLSTTTQVFTDPDMANPRKITIIRGDAYDSVSWPAKSWDVGRDINGLTFRFTIKDQIDGNVIFQSTGTGVSQVAAPVITSAQSILLQKTEVGDEYYWDLEIQYSATSFGTPLYGTVEVVDDVTTPGDRS